MNCRNCGAEYSDCELKCPYCQSENKQEAERRYSLKLDSYDKEAVEIGKLPEKIVGRTTKKLLILGVCVAGCMVLLLLSVFIVSRISVSKEYSMRKDYLEQLELYYQEQSYVEMREYIASEDLREDSYSKYIEVADAYYNYSKMCEEMEQLGDSTEDSNEIGISFSIENGVSAGAAALFTSKKCIEDRGIAGNEDILQNIYEKTAQKLREEFKLTEEEIENMAVNETEKTKMINEIADIVKERQG